jgi:ribosomal protein L28
MTKTTKKPKKKARLDVSQNALRVVEQAIGGKLIAPKKRRF